MNLDFSAIEKISTRKPKNGTLQARREFILPGGETRLTEPVNGSYGYASLREQQRLMETAMKVLKNERLNREIAEGCKAQILLDIGKGKDLREILLFAAEAISRLSGCGDSFFDEVRDGVVKYTFHADIIGTWYVPFELRGDTLITEDNPVYDDVSFHR